MLWEGKMQSIHTLGTNLPSSFLSAAVIESLEGEQFRRGNGLLGFQTTVGHEGKVRRRSLEQFAVVQRGRRPSKAIVEGWHFS